MFCRPLLHGTWPIALAILLFGVSARTDIAPKPLSTGGTTLKAVHGGEDVTVVRMTWEEVDLRPTLSRNHVRAVFGLMNTSDTKVQFEVGFPSYHENRLREFELWIDGEECVAEAKTEDLSDSKRRFLYWMCWPMEFEPGREVRVEVRYWCEVVAAPRKLWTWRLPEELRDQLYRRKSGYVLRTGANWAGSIGKATIRLHYGDEVKKGRLRFVDGSWLGGHDDSIMDWSYDPESFVETVVLEDFNPTDENDIAYEFDAVGPRETATLLMEAHNEGLLEPWAMQHLLELVEKHNVFEQDSGEQSATVVDILRRMVPPTGPKFRLRRPGEKLDLWAEPSSGIVERGAAAILEQTYERLLTILDARGEDTGEVRAAFDEFLNPPEDQEPDSPVEQPDR